MIPPASPEAVSGWQISTACDIRLQQFVMFNRQMGRDVTIDIDVNAIEEALSTLAPDVSRGKLLFFASDSDGLNADNEDKTAKPKAGEEAYLLGGLTTAYIGREEVEVRVGVTPYHTSIIDNEDYRAGLVQVAEDNFRKFGTDIESLANHPARNELLLSYISLILRCTLRASDDIQEVAVHELSHALDRTKQYQEQETGIAKEVSPHTKKTVEVISYLAAMTTTGLISYNSVRDFGLAEDLHPATTSALSLLLAFAACTQGVITLRDYRRAKNKRQAIISSQQNQEWKEASETRAKQTRPISKLLPNIIRVQGAISAG